jgi:hypothetical protein
MNLHGIVAPAIGAVNPFVQIVVQVSTGYTTEDSGKRSPSFAPPVPAWGQVQPLSYNDIQHLDALNIQGDRKAIYITGRLEGLVRPDKKGGDLISLPDGSLWLVAIVLENWPDWVKVAVTRQNLPKNSPSDPSLDFSNPNNSQSLPGTSA